jgi:hypothetical protein
MTPPDISGLASLFGIQAPIFAETPIMSASPVFRLGPLAPSNTLAAFVTPPTTPDVNALASVFGIQPPIFAQRTPAAPAEPVARSEPVKRMTYFAFDFDDVMRVNNVRHTGKIGFRVTGNSRGFLDRSVWESRNIKTERGLKQLMQGAMKFSSVVCVLIGTNTWFSRWVRYEIALAVVNERGLMAVDLNSLNHHQSFGLHGREERREWRVASCRESTGRVGQWKCRT